MNDKSHVGMSQCYFCGETKEIILDRRLKDTLPPQAVYNLEPCNKCKSDWEQGFVVFEGTEEQKYLDKTPKELQVQVEENKFVVLTGRFMVIDINSPLAQQYVGVKRIIVDESIFNAMFGEYLKSSPNPS